MSMFLVAEDLLLESSLADVRECYPEDYEGLTTNALMREIAHDPMMAVACNTDTLKRRVRELGFPSVTAHRFKERVQSSCKALREIFVHQNEWVGVGVVRVEINDEGKEVVLETHDTTLPLALVWAMYPRINITSLTQSSDSATPHPPPTPDKPLVHIEVICSITRTKAQSILLFLCGALRHSDEDISYMANNIADLQSQQTGRPHARILVVKIVE